MDSIWQRHRTFILKILAGLGVCLLAWIVGSALSGPGLDTLEARIEVRKSEIRGKSVHPRSVTREFTDASDVLLNRILFVANRVGETRTGEDLRVGLLRELLAAVGKDPSRDLGDYLQESRQFPQGCLTRLVGDARARLTSLANDRNVFIEEGLGFERVQMEPGELDRYLQTLKLIVHAVKLGIEEGAFEVKGLGVSTPSVRFEGDETFLRDFPVTVSYRGPSRVLLGILERLNDPNDPNDPNDFTTIRSLRRFEKERQERENDVMVMELELVALQIRPEAELVEVRR